MVTLVLAGIYQELPYVTRSDFHKNIHSRFWINNVYADSLNIIFYSKQKHHQDDSRP